MGKLTLILGGARSGKSSHAENLAAQVRTQILYIATAQPLDQEMLVRITKHQESRPKSWDTLEIPAHISQVLSPEQIKAQVVILDCLTLLISNLLVNLPDSEENPDEGLATTLVEAEISALISLIQSTDAHWIIVSNEVGMGLVPPFPLGRVYRDQLGWANKQLAQAADGVILMVAGIPWQIKPAPGVEL